MAKHRILRFSLLVFITSAILAWLCGYNFDSRNMVIGFLFLIDIVIIVMLVTFPTEYSWEKNIHEDNK